MSLSRTRLRAALADYLALRRGLGFQLQAAGRLLTQFVEYLEAHAIDTVTVEDALTWSSLPTNASPVWQAIRLSAVRGFAAYLHGVDSSVQVPPPGLVRAGPCRATPYLYSESDVDALMHAAGKLQPRLRAATYQHLLGLLTVTGLRVGEAIGLDDVDLDRGNGVLVVRNAKFGKRRLVPLHASTVAALTSYQELRDELSPRPASPALLRSTRGTRLLHSNINLTFTRLAAEAGIARRPGSCRPRLHDFRHSFAVASLLDWYTDGADVPAMMPRLATYLGHTDPKHTFWYLSAAPELMARALQRLDAYLDGRP